nr:MAG TPA: hypothetical protein [Caudoviricetes sp.]
MILRDLLNYSNMYLLLGEMVSLIQKVLNHILILFVLN